MTTRRCRVRWWVLAGLLLVGLTSPGCGDTNPDSPSADARSERGTTSADGVDLEALREALRIQERLVRVERVAYLLQAAREDQIEDVRAIFEGAPLDRGDVEAVLFVEWWARFRPRKAWKYTISGELHGEHPLLEMAAVRAWARQDPEAVIATGYGNNPQSRDGSMLTEVLDAVVVGWFESGRPGLEEWIAQRTTIADVTRATRTYARQKVLRDGAREALEWALNEAPFPARHNRLLLAAALTIVAHEDPALAIEWIPVAAEAGVDTRTFEMRIAGSWAHHDPRAALEWVRSIPDPGARAAAMRRATDRWQRADPEALIAWLKEYPDDGALDRARSWNIKGDVNQDPMSIDWPEMVTRTETIVDPARRGMDLVWVLQQWHYLEPDAANAWLDEHGGQLEDYQVRSAREISMGDINKLDRARKEAAAAAAVSPLRP